MHILVASANGYGNVGDDLATLAVGEFLEHQLTNPTIRYTRPPMQKELIAWADIVVIGAGGLFFDTLPDNVENYLAYLRAAKRQYKLTMVMGVGTQGIRTESAKAAYRDVLNKTDLITVRHQHDADILHALGVTKHIHVLADPVFSLHTSHAPYPKKPPRRKKPILAVSLANTRQRPEVMEKLDPALRDQWQRLADKTDASMAELVKKYRVRLVLQSEDDRELYQDWAAKYNLPIVGAHNKTNKPHASQSILNHYRDADFILTSRFHGFILALIAKKPVFALGFENTKIHLTVQTQIPALHAYFMTSEAFIADDTASLATCVTALQHFYKIQPEVGEQVAQTARLARAHETLIAQLLRKTKSRFKLAQSRFMRAQPIDIIN